MSEEETDVPAEPREAIARLEARIEELSDELERCRKFDALSKVLMAGGALWLAAGVFGVVGLSAMALIGSLAAVLGGIVLAGSNRSSMREIAASIAAAEAQRHELIGAIELRPVP